MESYFSLKEIKKSPHKYFNFYIKLLDNKETSDFLSPIFNIPRIPLIGSKNIKEDNNFSHNLGKILSLICFQIDICQGEEKNEIEQAFSDFNLPENIEEYLNIDEVIEIDNNTDEPENNLFFMPKKKLNFYLIFTDLPTIDEDKNEIKDEIKNETKNEIKNEIKNELKDEIKNEIKDEIKNETKNEIKNETKNVIKNEININKFDIKEEKSKDNLNKINFINDDQEFDEEYIEQENDNKDFEKNFKLYNIIPQFFYINDNEKSLLEIKNLNFQKQITLFTISNRNYYDIEIDHNKKEFIDINNLRAESSNIILDKENKFIIQDNLKFYLKITNDLSQFYLIYTSHENDYHSVFYYITCNNNETKNKMINLLKEAQNLNELINKMETNFKNQQVITNLKKIFKKNK